MSKHLTFFQKIASTLRDVKTKNWSPPSIKSLKIRKEPANGNNNILLQTSDYSSGEENEGSKANVDKKPSPTPKLRTDLNHRAAGIFEEYCRRERNRQRISS